MSFDGQIQGNGATRFSSFASEVEVSRKQDPYRKFRIPKADPAVDPEWCCEKFSVLQLGAHLVKLSVDLVSDQTATVWSRMCGRNITVREKLVGIYRTQPEMLCLKRKYEEQMKKGQQDSFTTGQCHRGE